MGIKNLQQLKGKPDLGTAFQEMCLNLQISMEHELKDTGFVSDRTTIDNALYWLKWHSVNATSTKNMEYYNICKKHAKSYDLVVYIPPEIPLVDDGFRSVSPQYQQEMDFLIQCLLHKMRPDNWMQVSGSVEERAAQVQRRIS